MAATRADVQAKIDAAIVELLRTTSSGSAMLALHGSSPATWPTGHWRTALTTLAAAKAELDQMGDAILLESGGRLLAE